MISGFVPPPEVANLLDRWIKLAVTQIEREGWSRSLPAESPIDPESWLESTLVDLAEKTGSASASSNAAVRSSLPCGDDPPLATSPPAGYDA